MGGAAKLKGVQAMHVKMAQRAKDEATSQVDALIVYPDRMRLGMDSPMGPMTVVIKPSGSFMAAQGRVQPIPPSGAKASLDQIKRDPVFIAAHLDDPKFTFAANGTAKVGSVDAKIVDVDADGTSVRWYVDPASGLLLRESYTAIGDAGTFNGETDLSEWKMFDGIKIPTKHLNRQNGTESSIVTFIEVSLNPQVDTKLFEKPAATASAQ